MTATTLARAEVERLFRESGYDLYNHAGYLIRSAHQQATLRFQTIMQGHSLTPTQMAALAIILRDGPLSQNQLGRLTSMDPSTISIVIRKLLRDRLVQRVGSDTDQRVSMISLTDRGVHYALSILPLGVAVSRAILSPLTPSEQVLFLSLLRRIAAAHPSP